MGLLYMLQNVKGALFFFFVEWVISLCQSDNIQNFSLKCDCPTISPHISSWINFALNHNVRNIHVRIRNKGRQIPKLPQSILTCKTLVKLCVHTDFSLDIPDSISFVCFPSLKILSFRLQYTDRSGGVLINGLLCGCPVLEDLTFCLYKQPHGELKNFNIFIPTLKRLFIFSDHKFVVRAPNLEYLKVRSSNFSLTNDMPIVSEAIVEFQPCPPLYTTTAEKASCAMQLLRGINCSKFLTLSEWTMEALCIAFNGDFPTFPNLKHLALESRCGWKLLPHFLSNSPNLEVLKWNKVDYFESVSVDFDGNKPVPSCLFLRLKIIEISSYPQGKAFGGADLEMAKYLLKSSEVLEKFLLCSEGVVGKRLQNKIHKCPKGSKACDIRILSNRFYILKVFDGVFVGVNMNDILLFEYSRFTYHSMFFHFTDIIMSIECSTLCF